MLQNEMTERTPTLITTTPVITYTVVQSPNITSPRQGWNEDSMNILSPIGVQEIEREFNQMVDLMAVDVRSETSEYPTTSHSSIACLGKNVNPVNPM